MIVEGGYIRVVQDVRGKYGSEGDYVMNRPLRGPQNPTPVDHATDTYDTIDWLVKNVPESNGKVGILGISYDGFLPLMALVQPAPGAQGVGADEPDGRRLDGRRLVPQRRVPPAEDGLHLRAGGDAQVNDAKWWTSHYDDYDMFMQAGSAGELGRRRGLEQVGFWRKLLEHPSYDAFWRDQAVDKLLAAQPLKVPVMLVHSLWDQEDIYGAIAVYKAIEPKDTGNDKVFLVMGPWHHGQEIGDGSALGALKFGSDTGAALPPRDPAAVPRPVPEGRRAEGRRRAGHGVRDRHERVAAAAGVAGRLRERLHGAADAALSRRRPEGSTSPRRRPATRRSTSTSPIPPSRCPSARGRSSRPAAGTLGASGWSTISARRRAGRTSWRSSPTC